MKLSEDGATLLWSFIDVGRCYNVDQKSPIRDIEVFRTSYSIAGAESQAWRRAGLTAAIRFIENPPTNFSETAAAGRALAADTFRQRLRNLPQHHLNVRCDIWGDRNGSNNAITQISLGICLNNAIGSGVPFALTTAEVICRQELTNRFVSSEITYSWSNDVSNVPLFDPVPLPTIIGGPNAPAADGGVQLLNSLFQDYPVVSARTIPGNVRTQILFQTPGVNPAPVNNCSSSLIETMVVQAILAPCQGVPDPGELTNNS